MSHNVLAMSAVADFGTKNFNKPQNLERISRFNEPSRPQLCQKLVGGSYSTFLSFIVFEHKAFSKTSPFDEIRPSQ